MTLTSRSPWIAARAAATPRHPALEVRGHCFDYAALEERARAVASQLLALGVGRGDRVAALLPNGLAFVATLHAVDLCGAAWVPLNVRLTARELRDQLEDCEPRVLVFEDSPLAETARHAARGAGVDAARIDALAPAPPKSDAPPAADPDAPFALVYTSGTSGRPKAAILSRANFLASAVASASALGVRTTDRWLASLPLFHVGGLSILLRSVLYGTAALVHERFDPRAVDRALDADRVSVISFTAVMLERLIAARGTRRAPDALRCVLVGGGPCPAPLEERARKLGFPIAPTYGLTEAASQVATRPPDRGAVPARTSLVPLPGTRVRCVDDDGRALPAGEPGEIWVRGPTVMAGYWGDPEASASALRDGWLHTGDVGFLDAFGALHVLERRTDLIVSGGENVYPAEVEAMLCEHPAIAEAGVTGVADAEFGRRPAAWLVAVDPEATPSADALRAFCRARLAGYKVPVAFRWVDALPRSAAGKLLRAQLR